MTVRAYIARATPVTLVELATVNETDTAPQKGALLSFTYLSEKLLKANWNNLISCCHDRHLRETSSWNNLVILSPLSLYKYWLWAEKSNARDLAGYNSHHSCISVPEFWKGMTFLRSGIWRLTKCNATPISFSVLDRSSHIFLIPPLRLEGFARTHPALCFWAPRINE